GCSARNALPTFHDPFEAPPAIATAARAVVRIRTANAYATGSFITSDGVLLTNNHVLGIEICPQEGCSAQLTWLHQRRELPQVARTIFFKPLHVDAGLDLAVLQAYSSDRNTLATPDFVNLASLDAASLRGTRVHVIGHP